MSLADKARNFLTNNGYAESDVESVSTLRRKVVGDWPWAEFVPVADTIANPDLGDVKPSLRLHIDTPEGPVVAKWNTAQERFIIEASPSLGYPSLDVSDLLR